MGQYPGTLHLLTTEAWGGLEMYVFELVNKLVKDGLRCSVYCLPNTVIEQKFQSAGIPTISAYKHSKYNLKDILKVRKIMRDNDYQIIHAHTNVDAWRGSLALNFDTKRKLIFNLYMGVVNKKDLIHRFIFRKIDALVSTSEIINNEVKEKYPINKNKIRLIRYGREVENYVLNSHERDVIREKYNTAEKDIVVGTMCRIDVQKGVKELVCAFLNISEKERKCLKIWIIGDPTILKKDENGTIIFEKEAEETNNYLINFIQKNNLGGQIKLIPYQPDMISYLSALDIFVLASYNEMYSLAILDAMLLGLPVISTDKGGTPEQLGYGERGFLAEPKNAKSLAEKITYCLRNPEETKMKAEMGKLWTTSEHDWKNVLIQYANLYAEVLNN